MAGAVELELRMWVDGPNRTPEQVDRAVRERVREMDAALFAVPDMAEPQRLDPPAVDWLGEVHVPTLLIVGDQDQPNTLAAVDTMAVGIPGARKIVVPGAAHMVNMERPDAFTPAVLDFLAGVDHPGS